MFIQSIVHLLTLSTLSPTVKLLSLAAKLPSLIRFMYTPIFRDKPWQLGAKRAVWIHFVTCSPPLLLESVLMHRFLLTNTLATGKLDRIASVTILKEPWLQSTSLTLKTRSCGNNLPKAEEPGVTEATYMKLSPVEIY